MSCGARLRHPREFADHLREMTPSVSVATFGNVGAALLAAVYGLAIAVLLPEWLAAHWLAFAAGGIVALATGRFLGRFIARQVNDSTV